MRNEIENDSRQQRAIQEEILRLLDLFKDGLQISDLPGMTYSFLRITDTFDNVDEANKKKTICSALIKIVEETDTPWMPDEITDPILIHLIPAVVDKLFSVQTKINK